MFLLNVIFSLGAACAAGASSSGSSDQSSYYTELLTDYAERAPQRLGDWSRLSRARDLGPAASFLFRTLHTTFHRQTRGDREGVILFFGHLAAMGLRFDLDRSRRDVFENEYRTDLRILMMSGPDLVGIPYVIRTLTLFAHGKTPAGSNGIQAVATAALDPVVDALVERAGRPDAPGAELAYVSNLLSYIATPRAKTAVGGFKVVVLRPSCDPLITK